MSEEKRVALQTRGWIGSFSYDTVVAAYSLLAPLACYRIAQRRLTVLNIRLDGQVMAQWG